MSNDPKVSAATIAAFIKASGLDASALSTHSLTMGLNAAFASLLLERHYVARHNLMEELLEVIHNDDGQHTDAVGIEQSMQDAISEHMKLRAVVNTKSVVLSEKALSNLDAFCKAFEDAQKNYVGFLQVLDGAIKPEHKIFVNHKLCTANVSVPKSVELTLDTLRVLNNSLPADTNSTSKFLAFERNFKEYAHEPDFDNTAIHILHLYLSHIDKMNGAEHLRRDLDKLLGRISSVLPKNRKTLFDLAYVISNDKKILLNASWRENLRDGTVRSHQLNIWYVE